MLAECVQFQTISWEGYDYEGKYRVYAFGRTEEGKSACVHFPFKPFFYVGLKRDGPNINHGTILKSLFDVFEKKITPFYPCDRHNNSNCTRCDMIERPAVWDDYKIYGVQRFVKHEAINLWGFNNENKIPLVKLVFDSSKNMRYFKNKIRFHRDYETNFQLFEANLDPILRVLHVTGCSSTGWVQSQRRLATMKQTTCDIEIEMESHLDVKPLDRQDIAPFRTGSFDIECFSESGAFPKSTNREDLVFQIGLTRQDYGNPDLERVGLSLGPCQEGPSLFVYETEKELLLAFTKLVHEWDLDIITGWNVWGFDFEYIMNRYAEDVDFMKEFCRFGRFLDGRGESKLVEKTLSSSALGDNKLMLLPMSGRFVFDLMHLVKRELNMDSYSLNNVSKDLLNDKKIDMPPQEIFARWRRRDPLEIKEVCEYCIKDTVLPIHIMDKLKTIPNLVEMAKATWVPMNFLTERGQQIKVFSLMVKTANEHSYSIPTLFLEPGENAFEGATVLEPQKGAYYEPIVALDFASLYPSIMRAHNLCYSTYVFDTTKLDHNAYDYEMFEFSGEKHYFVRNRKGEEKMVFALLPHILAELKNFRSQAKRDMAGAKGTPLEAVYNGKQLAYKVVMNSVYGFTGVSKGMLGLKQIASAVTSKGRQMIDDTKRIVESNFDCSTVVYGDSVSGDTPLVLRHNGKIITETIENLGKEWSNHHCGKESCELEGLETWTDEGWKKVERVIRHKLAPEKNMVRVVTHTGSVICTDDHSLLRSSGEMVSSKELVLGDILLSKPLIFEEDETGISNDLAWVMGLFMADGSCGMYKCPSGSKTSWAINKGDIELLKLCKIKLEKEYPDYEWVIIDTMKSSGVYKLQPRGDIISLVKYWRSILYYDKSKIVPNVVLNGTKEVRQNFWEGLYCGDGSRSRTTPYKKGNQCGAIIDQKSQISCLCIFLLASSLDFKVSIGTRKDKLDIYRIRVTKSKLRKLEGEVKKIEVLPWEEQYVYDLTTENHHFQAGVGSLIVHNTDSVMVKFNLPEHLTMEEKIAEAWKLGEKAADMCKFPPPNELELEKVYCPYILYSKKRYAAKMWVQNKKGEMELEKVDIKGLQVIRRDQTPFVRETGKRVLDILLDSRDSTPAMDYVLERGKMLLSGEVPVEMLMDTRSLKDDGFKTEVGSNPEYYPPNKPYNKRNLPHVWVRDKMWDRKPGSEPRQGERVPFLVTDTGNPKHKLFEKAEDPVFVKENNIKLDFSYYLGKLKKPVNDLLAPVIGDKGDPLESLVPKITTVDECETKEQVDKFSMKQLREWTETRISLPKGISKWKKPDWVHQVCVIKGINKKTALETAFSFDKF